MIALYDVQARPTSGPLAHLVGALLPLALDSATVTALDKVMCPDTGPYRLPEEHTSRIAINLEPHKFIVASPTMLLPEGTAVTTPTDPTPRPLRVSYIRVGDTELALAVHYDLLSMYKNGHSWLWWTAEVKDLTARVPASWDNLVLHERNGPINYDDLREYVAATALNAYLTV